MINDCLLKCFIEHPAQTVKSAKQILAHHPRVVSNLQDVYDTKAEYKRRFPGAINKYQQGQMRNHTFGELPITSYQAPAKILLFDLETAPMVSYHWRRFKENVGIDQTISESFIICYSAKWLYAADVMSDCCTPSEVVAQDDSRVCESLWKLINEADIIVAHNGLNADVPWMNSRFILNGLNPPSSYRVVDTLLIAKKKFGFSSNKLDALGTYFGVGNKIKTDFSLWRGCMEGSQESLDQMVTYNKQDVVLLEEVYIALRPWAGTLHPNVNTYSSEDGCTICGSGDYELIPDAFYVTPYNRYRLYRCRSCGAVFHARKSCQCFKPIFGNCAK